MKWYARVPPGGHPKSVEASGSNLTGVGQGSKTTGDTRASLTSDCTALGCFAIAFLQPMPAEANRRGGHQKSRPTMCTTYLPTADVSTVSTPTVHVCLPSMITSGNVSVSLNYNFPWVLIRLRSAVSLLCSVLNFTYSFHACRQLLVGDVISEAMVRE